MIEIQNDAQMSAAEKWLERFNRHIIDLQKMEKMSSLTCEDHLKVSKQLHDNLQKAIEAYKEPKDDEEEEQLEPVEEPVLKKLEPAGESGDDTGDADPGGDSTSGEGAVTEELEEEVDDVVPSENPKSYW